jgi:hypothetical protein
VTNFKNLQIVTRSYLNLNKGQIQQYISILVQRKIKKKNPKEVARKLTLEDLALQMLVRLCKAGLKKFR